MSIAPIIRIVAQGISQSEIQVPKGNFDASALKTMLQITFGVFGAVALLVIVLAGFRYTISMGDPQKTATAKNTIIYALVGLIIAMSAFAIVTFVIKNI